MLLAFDLWRLARQSGVPRAARADPALRDAAGRLDEALALIDAVSIALFVVEEDGRIAFMNRASRMLAGFEAGRLHDITGLGEAGAATILALPVGGRQLIRLADDRSMLVWTGSIARPRAAPQRLISLQAVAGELDAVQVGAWHGMTRVLAHEMMNSLTPIASMAESMAVLMPDAGTDPRIAGAVATIARRSRHLIDFVDRYRAIVDLPRPERVAVDAAAFLADIDRLTGADVRARGIGFAVTMIGEGVPVTIDPALIEQAVINLIKNAADAVEAMPDPAIGLACLQTRDALTLSVSDNGCGIDDEQIEDIFVPFFTTKPGGAGIGLALARQIALAHGGSLAVRRIRQGGTAFDLVVPIPPAR